VIEARNHDTPSWRDDKRWTPPCNVLKINFDGAFRQQEKDGAWGFLIRE